MAVEAVPATLLSQLRKLLDGIAKYNVEITCCAEPSTKIIGDFGTRVASTNVEIKISDSR